MKKALIKIGIVLLSFILTVIIVENLINTDESDLTTEMTEASLPVITTQYNGITLNRMYGYLTDMDLSYMRDTITPLSSGRKLTLCIDTYSTSVLGIAYEVRDVETGRLIENTEIEDFSVDSRKIIKDITIKDLIENDTEYELIFKLTLGDGRVASYYTRMISADDYHVGDKLEYVSNFTSTIFNKSAADSLKLYLESNSQGDNSTLGYVNIHSSLNQVTWGSLSPLRVTDPVIDIKELSSLTGSFVVEYYVSTSEETDITYYKVREFYRIRYGRDRIYLLDYERTMDQVFDNDKGSFESGNVMLGITSGEETFEENEDGSSVAFATGGRLFKYDGTSNSIAYLFGFYDTFTVDMRDMNDKHKIKIMDVDEAGDVTFLVYGYMNRGDHEGQVGTAAYYYDASVNTIEELAYIESSHAPDLLISEVDQVSYMNSEHILYLLIGGRLCLINAEDRTYEVVAENLREGSYYVSKSGRMIVWQDSDDNTDCQKLVLMNLDTGKKNDISVSSNETISPFGFMGEDMIYGIAYKDDVTKDRTGSPLIPMREINIYSEGNGNVMSYENDDIFVTDCEINGNLITLKRLKRTSDGSLEETLDDQIVNAEDITATKNKITSIVTEDYEKQYLLSTVKDIDSQTLKTLKPKMLIYEGDRNLMIPDDNSSDRYIVYGKYGADGSYVNANTAVERAYDISGIVMDDSGDYIYRKTARSTKNQIMAIEAETVSESRRSLAVCLDSMIAYEGVVRNSEYMLETGESVIDILKDALPEYDILDLNGCSLDIVLYYVNIDIPVLSLMNDGTGVLIIGFNEDEIVLMDPQSEELYKITMDEATELFDENGNCFITYVPNTEN